MPVCAYVCARFAPFVWERSALRATDRRKPRGDRRQKEEVWTEDAEEEEEEEKEGLCVRGRDPGPAPSLGIPLDLRRVRPANRTRSVGLGGERRVEGAELVLV